MDAPLDSRRELQFHRRSVPGPPEADCVEQRQSGEQQQQQDHGGFDEALQRLIAGEKLQRPEQPEAQRQIGEETGEAVD